MSKELKNLFKKYSSIENTYRTKYLLIIRDSINMGYCKDDFIVEEKVHGANFALYCDGIEVKGAKRSGFVDGDGSGFYNSHLVVPLYDEKMRALYNELGKTVRVSGELYGGRYPEVDPKHKGIKAVQKGVDYNPDVDFYAFDIYTYDEITEEWNCLDKITQNEIFERYGFFYAKPLLRGTLEECIAYPNAFKSKIPEWLGLPEHPGENICEGTVIKPVEFATTGNGSRILLKNKNEKFSEVAHGKKGGKPKKAIKISEEGNKVKDLLNDHITENRLRNVLSKVGDVNNKMFGQIMNLFTSDILEDFNKDYSNRFKKLDNKEQSVIKKYLGTRASELLRKNFLNIIDGEF